MRSDKVKEGFERAPHRSLLRACGVRKEDMGKPFIGVCNSYIDVIPGTRPPAKARQTRQGGHPRGRRRAF